MPGAVPAVHSLQLVVAYADSDSQSDSDSDGEMFCLLLLPQGHTLIPIPILTLSV